MIIHWIIGYFEAQNIRHLNNIVVVGSKFDRKINSSPDAVYPYLLGNVYIGYVIWRLLFYVSNSQYYRSKLTFLALIDQSLAIFKKIPTKMTARTGNIHGLLTLVQKIDGESNCYPSLHVSMAITSFYVLKQIANINSTKTIALENTCIAICRSTLETKQHSVICVIGGLAIADQVLHKYFGANVDFNMLQKIIPELKDAEAAEIIKILKENYDLEFLFEKLRDYFALAGNCDDILLG